MQGVPSLIFSLEMRPERLMPRLVARHSHMDSKKVFAIEVLRKAYDELMDVPLYFAYVYKKPTYDVCADTIRSCVRRYGIQFVVFDNLHFLVRSVSDQVREVSLITQNFKLLAEELGIPIVLIARPRKGTNKIITNMDLKDSSDIEADCFGPEAEVLTPNGWIRFDQYKDQLVAQYNLDGTVSFVVPKKYVKKPYNGKMIEFSNRQKFYSFTTPTHKFPLISRVGKFKKCYAEDLCMDNKVIRTALYNGPGVPLTNDEIRFCVAVSADFTMRKGGDLYASFSKNRKIIRIKKILTSLNIPFSSHIEPSRGSTNIYISRKVAPTFVFKEFPHSWIYETSLSQKRVIIDEIVNWDGNHVLNRKQIEYTSTIYSNAVFIQTISHLAGYVSTIKEQQNYKNQKWYKVSVLFNKQYTDTKSLCKHRKEIDYVGLIYCITVDSGMILVRQNGCISVSGNSDIVILLHREPKGGEGTDYPQFEEHEGVFDERTLVRVSKSRYSIGGQLYLKSIDAECRIEEYQ
jgi:replicative DNA helicase